MRIVALLVLLLGCSASGGGDTVDRGNDSGVDVSTSDTSTPTDTSTPSGDAIFPTEDGAVVDTTAEAIDCGTVGKVCCGTTCSVG